MQPFISNYAKSSNIGQSIALPAKTIYDTKFKNEGEATVAGVFFFVTPILFTLFCILKDVTRDGLQTYFIIMTVGAIVLRLVSTLWIASLAKKMNRNEFRWTALALIVPGIALTIIGQKKKIKDPNAYKQFLYVPKIAQLNPTSQKHIQAGHPLLMAS